MNCQQTKINLEALRTWVRDNGTAFLIFDLALFCKFGLLYYLIFNSCVKTEIKLNFKQKKSKAKFVQKFFI